MKKCTTNLSILIILASMAIALSAAAEPLLDSPGLVTTEWLAANSAHPDLRIVDAREGLRSYIQGHIPGAIYLNTETLRISEEGVPARLLPPGRLAEIFSRIGIGNMHTVVIYSSGGETSQIWFTLRHVAGLPDVASYDGSLIDWISKGLPLSGEAEE